MIIEGKDYKYSAMDRDGFVFLYEYEPTYNARTGEWLPLSGSSYCVVVGKTGKTMPHKFARTSLTHL